MQPAIANLGGNLGGQDGRSIPYRWATPGQQAQAVLFVAQQLHDHFPTLSVKEFSKAFHAFKPKLWEDRNGICLDYADLVRLTQRVARSPLVPDFEPPIYCADAYYLAEVQEYYSQVAAELLAELKAAPQIPSKRLVSFIADLANGNCVVERVLRETQSKAVAHDPPTAAE